MREAPVYQTTNPGLAKTFSEPSLQDAMTPIHDWELGLDHKELKLRVDEELSPRHSSRVTPRLGIMRNRCRLRVILPRTVQDHSSSDTKQ